ncbi:MAG TPA: glycosyltransferase family 39 protein [Chryseosolibacter sp.]|nr:glycosyltransferase family 39 protein [Chryseosolibacter sp.]
MLKTAILNYQTSLRNSIKSTPSTVWLIATALVPILVFATMLFFQEQIASAIMSLFPPAQQHGVSFYNDLVYLMGAEILWLGFFFLFALLLYLYASPASLDNFINIRTRSKALYYMMLVASGFFLAAVFISDSVLEEFPNSSDEYAYLLQAEMFSRGKLWERAHDLPDFFYHINIAQHEGILVSRFPPGWPLILSIAFEIGLNPALMNPVLGLIALVVFYSFLRRYYDTRVAVWSMLAVAFTGFYLFNAASYFSHIACLLVTLLFVFNVYLYQEKKRFFYGLLAGLFLGFVVIIRYYTAVLIFIPFFIYLAFEHRWRAVPLFLWMAIGSVPCLAYLLWYNYSITGNALLPVTMWAYPAEQLGFVKGHSVMKGIEHLARRMLMFIYWTSPGLLILYLVFVWRKIKSPVGRWLKPEDYAFITLAIGYFFYHEIGGNQYGPRFMFEGFPFLVAFVVSKVLETREKWAVALLLASLAFAIVKLPFVAQREGDVIDQRQDMYDLVKEQNIHNAIVFVASSTSPIRPMPTRDLTRNDPKFMNDVIYVLPIRGINDQIMEYYGDRAVYRYERDIDDLNGHLIRIR